MRHWLCHKITTVTGCCNYATEGSYHHVGVAAEKRRDCDINHRLSTSCNASVQLIECLLSESHQPITAEPFSSLQDFSAETEDPVHTVPIYTPPCQILPTNQDTLIQPGPSTSGHIDKLDMGWRNTSRSIFQ
ncbi:hypothetical protein TNCV_1794321 [Trichonephila clavipes]|nr:hypothetical protein TNCV_1794321 [Trichonephila clavipes]